MNSGIWLMPNGATVSVLNMGFKGVVSVASHRVILAWHFLKSSGLPPCVRNQRGFSQTVFRVAWCVIQRCSGPSYPVTRIRQEACAAVRPNQSEQNENIDIVSGLRCQHAKGGLLHLVWVVFQCCFAERFLVILLVRTFLHARSTYYHCCEDLETIPQNTKRPPL